jgi:hypothetical protein
LCGRQRDSLTLRDAHVVLAHFAGATVGVRSTVTGDGFTSSSRATLAGRAISVVAALLAKVVDAELSLVAILVVVTFGVVRTASDQR